MLNDIKGHNSDRSRWPAPAKLNLFLRIVGRRSDGYHELQTLFQFVDWCDWLAFEINSTGELHCRGLPDIADGDNLILRAAKLLQTRTGTNFGAAIAIEKCLPVGAGLGGGSSDAATTLVALNRLWGGDLDADTLAALGAQLGADVPVFVHGQAALAEGTGDQLLPVEPDCPWYLIIDCGARLSTRAVFEHPTLTRNSPKETMTGFALKPARNDCEAVSRLLAPEVGRALDWLSDFKSAHLTGTGGAIFAAFEDKQDALDVADKVPGNWQAKVARGLNRSPLRLRTE